MLDPRTLFTSPELIFDPKTQLGPALISHEDLAKPGEIGTALPASVSAQSLPLIVGLNGFGEAGHIVGQMQDAFLESLDHEIVTEFDTDQLVDYRDRRPAIEFDQDHMRNYRQPRIVLYRMKDLLGKEFLFLTGSEPDYQWERFISAVGLVIRHLNVTFVTWVHGIAMPVPHTRPLGVSVHGNRADLIELGSGWRPRAELPSSVAHLLELRLMEQGHSVTGFSIHVPHYVAEARYAPAALSALEYLSAATGLMLPSEQLRESGRTIEAQIAQQMAQSDEVRGVVAQLERRWDEFHQDSTHASVLEKAEEELLSADEIGAEIEAFLASVTETDDEGEDEENLSDQD